MEKYINELDKLDRKLRDRLWKIVKEYDWEDATEFIEAELETLTWELETATRDQINP